tara:strand:- start:227 stop:535 length:309 start_codon:yes stop_codon:yes gene_type:complete
MTRITAENIRERMEELQEEMALLERFNTSGFTATVCDDSKHKWQITEENLYSVGRIDDYTWFVRFRCSRCGVETERAYTEQAGQDKNILDPWAALRPEQEEE